MTTYLNDIENGAASNAAAQRDAQNRAVFEEILRTWPLADHKANYQLLLEYSGGELTIGKFQYFLANPHRDFTLDFTEEHGELIDAICQLLYDPYGRRMNPFDLKNERAKMKYWTRGQLRARLQEVQAKQALAKKPVAEIKADLAAMRKAQEGERPYPSYPTLLPTIVPRGEVQARDTREYLNLIARTDIYTFKRLVTMYGSAQITDIMQGRRY